MTSKSHDQQLVLRRSPSDERQEPKQAPPHASAQGSTLRRLAGGRDPSKLRALLEAREDLRGEQLDAMADASGKTPLHHAAWRGALECVTLLLDFGACVDAVATGPFTYGKTPLFFALTWSRDDVCLLLLRRGASTKIVNNKGQTPRSLAASHCNEETRRAIARAEEQRDDVLKEWRNYREHFSDGCIYGDLDVRFLDRPLRPEDVVDDDVCVNPTTAKTRRGNFDRNNPDVARHFAANTKKKTESSSSFERKKKTETPFGRKHLDDDARDEAQSALEQRRDLDRKLVEEMVLRRHPGDVAAAAVAVASARSDTKRTWTSFAAHRFAELLSEETTQPDALRDALRRLRDLEEEEDTPKGANGATSTTTTTTAAAAARLLRKALAIHRQEQNVAQHDDHHRYEKEEPPVVTTGSGSLRRRAKEADSSLERSVVASWDNDPESAVIRLASAALRCHLHQYANNGKETRGARSLSRVLLADPAPGSSRRAALRIPPALVADDSSLDDCRRRLFESTEQRLVAFDAEWGEDDRLATLQLAAPGAGVFVVDCLATYADGRLSALATDLLASNKVLLLGFAPRRDLEHLAALAKNPNRSTRENETSSSSSRSSQQQTKATTEDSHHLRGEASDDGFSWPATTTAKKTTISVPYTPVVLDLQRLAVATQTHASSSWSRAQPPSLAAVVRAELGLGLDKSLQRVDWAERPLDAPRLHYAGLDAAVLLCLLEPLLEKDRRRASASAEDQKEEDEDDNRASRREKCPA